MIVIPISHGLLLRAFQPAMNFSSGRDGIRFRSKRQSVRIMADPYKAPEALKG
jgi:hypothetical protein